MDITVEEVRKLCEKFQPDMEKLLQTHLGHLDREDFLVVAEFLFRTGHQTTVLLMGHHQQAEPNPKQGWN